MADNLLLTSKYGYNIRNLMIATQLVSTTYNKYFLFWRLTNNIYSNVDGFAQIPGPNEVLSAYK